MNTWLRISNILIGTARKNLTEKIPVIAHIDKRSGKQGMPLIGETDQFINAHEIFSSSYAFNEPIPSNLHGKEENVNSEAKVSSLVDLVHYQEKSVVSKTLLERKTGTVTLFAFDQGQGLSEHATPFDALVYVLDGHVEIEISGSPFRLKRGQMIIMPANEPHALKGMTKFKMMLIMIRS